MPDLLGEPEESHLRARGYPTHPSSSPERQESVTGEHPCCSDHEYEPISPPPEAQGPPAPPAVHVTNIEGITIQEPPEGPDSEPIMTDNESAGSPVRRPVDEVAVPHDGDVEDRAMSGGQMGDSNGSLGAPEDEVSTEYPKGVSNSSRRCAMTLIINFQLHL